MRLAVKLVGRTIEPSYCAAPRAPFMNDVRGGA